jgi:hypothetical protein
MRCGRPDAEADALDFTNKTAPDGVAYDDLNTSESNERDNDRARMPAKRSRRQQSSFRGPKSSAKRNHERGNGAFCSSCA